MPTRRSKLAVWSALCGALSLVPVGVFSVLAIVFGHLARRRIKRSDGALSGDETAKFGLFFGYLTALVIAGFVLAIPKIEELGNRSYQHNVGRQLFLACRLYASDHDGQFPPDLATLVEENIVESLDRFTRWSGDGDATFETHPAWDYRQPQGATDYSEDYSTIMAISAWQTRAGERVAVYAYGGIANLKDDEIPWVPFE